ncbi:MAG: BtpA/SgcQ family protein [Lachnospiraceae bacterium]|nr:BtpA/SgcQ family protein [Lachnospiraceae bacterium]
MAKEILTNGSATLIGMVHCLALPGSACYGGDFQKVIDQAVADAKTLEEAGFDAVIVENMNDLPASARLNKIQVAALTACACAVRNAVSIPIGIDAAFCDPEASLAIAAVSGADFIRNAVYVDTVLFTDGILYPTCRETIELRNRLGIQNVKILADVQVKHTHMLADVDIKDSIHDAVGNGADGLIITGAACGCEAPIDLVRMAKDMVKIPVFAGSGVNVGNIKEQFTIADGGIIGSSIKQGGVLTNPVDFDLAKQIVDALK